MLTRTLTAIVLLAVVVGALFLDPTGWAVRVLVILIGAIAGLEFGAITKVPFPLIIPGVFVLLGVISRTMDRPEIYAGLAYLAIPFIFLAVVKKTTWLSVIFGSMWIYGSIMAFYILSSTKSPANWPLLLTAAIPIWCGDTAAIFVGKAFGEHPMAPEISPKKTWEGATGNFLACLTAALTLGAIFHYPMLPMALLGLNCGIVGQAGDLFESWLKRKADMKDSGNILPGHGGLLDRIDSLMATAPISLLILQTLLPHS